MLAFCVKKLLDRLIRQRMCGRHHGECFWVLLGICVGLGAIGSDAQCWRVVCLTPGRA